MPESYLPGEITLDIQFNKAGAKNPLVEAMEWLSNIRIHTDPHRLVLSMVSELFIKPGKPLVRCDDLKTDGS